MGKKKLPLQGYDFYTGVLNLIPTTTEAYIKCGKCPETIVKRRKHELRDLYKKMLLSSISYRLTEIQQRQFPTENEVLVFIVQYFISKKDYDSTDLDNMAKTILDILKGQLYSDDRQVRVLLILKKMIDKLIPQNYTFIAVKELKDDKDSTLTQVAGIERSISEYHETRKRA
ncbi:RusA family crossover junction endodeoxyribonuclease [Patescibacteria group bacterium]|nr:RusA family crossover junction endodeoxyribonuclease [Patescibacteria group bacterium]